MFIKILLLALLLVILLALGSGLVFLMHDSGPSRRTARALTARIGLSIMLFILMLLAVAAGLLSPHGLMSLQ